MQICRIVLRRTHYIADGRYYTYCRQSRLTVIIIEVHFDESLVLTCQVSRDLNSEWSYIVLENSHELI